ncbi:hypothetical protein HYT57_03810 [Candidatus Woesearchaeota archaeon]|nr:hypothetical protein [Candidatus Woesearchaeota archaeon]
MKINPNYIITASKEVLSGKNYLISFIALIFIILAVFISIPVFLIPANSLLFQLTVFTIKDYVLLTILSVLTSLLIVMQIFSYKKAKLYSSGRTAIGGGSAVVAALFGTVSCSACLVAVFGFLGIGTVFFLVEYQWFIVGLAILIMLVSLYFTSLKLNGGCDSCKK